MTIKQRIEKDLGFGVMASSIEGVDYQCNACFALAKQSGRNPLNVAEEIVKKFKSDVATAVVSAPGFINLTITDKAFADLGNTILKTKALPLVKQSPRKIFFDYGGANVAKELHIGHLRPPIVGEALRRVFKAFGHRVTSDVYLGDWGLQIGLVMAELELQFGKTFNQGNITIDMLNELYPQASRRKDQDEKFKEHASDLTKKLQQHKEPYFSIWKEIWDVSVVRIKENYARLGCYYDLFHGESHAQSYVDHVLEILKPHTFVDKDCLLIDVKKDSDNKPMPPIILKKQNGADLYATSDIATIYYRQRDFSPDEYVYVTDFRQNLHFEQIFRAVKKGGLVPESTKFVHIGLGTITGKDGKPFKTRAGGTIKLEDVMELVIDGAKARLLESGRTLDELTAEKIGLSALKFADLIGNVKSGYIFDIDKFTDFNGKTGPYLLYTIARINSILEKQERTIASFKEVKEAVKVYPENCRPILSRINKLSDAFTAVTEQYSLNALADAVYELAREFNNFYGATNILREPDSQKQSAYLNIARLVKIAMEFTLDTLAIDFVEKM